MGAVDADVDNFSESLTKSRITFVEQGWSMEKRLRKSEGDNGNGLESEWFRKSSPISGEAKRAEDGVVDRKIREFKNGNQYVGVECEMTIIDEFVS